MFFIINQRLYEKQNLASRDCLFITPGSSMCTTPAFQTAKTTKASSSNEYRYFPCFVLLRFCNW